MFPPELRIYPVLGLPEVRPGCSISACLCAVLGSPARVLQDFDILVVAHKVISKAEGRLVPLGEVKPSEQAKDWAASYGKDARVVELALQEAVRVVRMENGVLITETRQGFVCANSGVDTSNVPPGYAVLLPEDPDRSAEELRKTLSEALHVQLAVIVSDTFGRPWREGLVNVAIGVAGFGPLTDYRGESDSFGKTMRASVIASADELASAAEVVMGKTRRVPAAIIRGFRWDTDREGSGRQLLRPAKMDLFR